MRVARQETGYFDGCDGAPLYWQSWRAPDEPAEVRDVVIIHGGMEHSGRYEPFVEAFTDPAYRFFAMDLRGHGKSSGTRGGGDGFHQYVSDVERFLDFLLREKQVSKPLLLGHSLGGLICLTYCLEEERRKKITALATSGAATKVRLNLPTRFKQLLAKSVLIKIAPELRVPAGLELKYLSHDADVIKAYKRDPLVFSAITVRMGLAILSAGEQLRKDAYLIRDLPVYMAHGMEDGIADPTGTEEVFQQIQASNKTLKMYPDLYHEIFNERSEDRSRVITDLKDWIVKNHPTKAPPVPVDGP